MNCPYCNRRLCKGEDGIYSHLDYMTECKGRLFDGNKELWQELTKTKRALDVAVEHLNGIRGCDKNGNPQTGVISCWLDLDELGKALDRIKQITETKDVK